MGKLKFVMMTAAIVTSLTSVEQFAIARNGGSDPGGGDAVLITATAYPPSKVFTETLELIPAWMRRSRLSESLKTQTIGELNQIVQNQKILQLPGDLILIPEESPQGYSIPQDDHSFLSLGGMTYRKVGAPIYLSRRVLDYDKTQLGSLIMHEIFHHTVGQTLSENESFIIALTSSVQKSQPNHAVDVALDQGIYLGAGKIRGRELAVTLGLAYRSLIKTQPIAQKYSEKDLEDVVRTQIKIWSSAFPEDATNLPVSTLSLLIAKTCLVNPFQQPAANSVYDDLNESHLNSIWPKELVGSVGYKINPQNPILSDVKRYLTLCKVSVLNDRCSAGNEILLSDVVNLGRRP